MLLRNKLRQLSVITGKENAAKYWSYTIAMFLTSFNVYFVFGNACFMYISYVLKLLCGFFGQGLAFLVNTGCAVL